MRSKLFTLIGCVLLAACGAVENIKETGITRDRAISIAKTSCKEYPDTYSYVDRAEWIPEKKVWAVEISDRDGLNGKVYKISRSGEVVGSKAFSDEDRRGGRGGYYGRGPGYGWWY